MVGKMIGRHIEPFFSVGTWSLVVEVKNDELLSESVAVA